MPNTGISTTSLSTLADRLKAKTEEDRQTTERLIEAEFRNLSANVRASMKSALTTIEAATLKEAESAAGQITGRMRLLNSGFMKHWLICGLLGLGLTCGLALGGWGLATLAQHHITNLREEVTTLNRQKAALENTLGQLQSQTWNLTLTETKDGRFIILPPKTIPKTGWTFGKQEAVKLE
ncbi:MAG: hypothetical protein LBP22_03305 [Deltaproteobacteria bacterium]|jgi:hypothetical protein|nr:hypothetical protein [Deltaproteobacteria bacterium]